MSSEAQRGPTPAVYRTSPLYDVYGTLHPYINHKSSGITPYLTSLKRAIAPFNPFALQQVPTTDSIGLGSKFGQRWWRTDPYPTRIVREDHFASHYDPFLNPRFKKPSSGTPLSFTPGLKFQFFPRHCTRILDAYRTCLISNDDNKNLCSHEGQNILAICPPWALDKMKQNNKLKLKLQAQANIKYRQVMEVPDYNAGRTAADVPVRDWSYGERTNLRPNSMWADDRYADITQKQIDEAKKRVKKRAHSRGQKPDSSVHIEPYNRSFENPSTKIPLYP